MSATPFLPSPPRSPAPRPQTPKQQTATTPKQSKAAPASPLVVHPFAANAKGSQSPPLYYKRSHTRSRTPERAPAAAAPGPVQLQTPPQEPPPTAVGRRRVSFQPIAAVPGSPTAEARLWDDALDSVINDATGKIDLQNHGITSIPHNIADAAKFVVLQKKSAVESNSASTSPRGFDRTKSAPAVFASGSSRQPLGRSKTTMLGSSLSSDSAPKKKMAEIQILLGSNAISMLPTELFRLRGLTVLSLRRNCLTEIPPAVATLTNLEELNLSMNQIKFLPAEITHLKSLKTLSITSNPLLPLPSTSGPRCLGPLKVLHENTIPSLAEMALSVLLSTRDDETQLEAYYTLPLPEGYLPNETMDKINAALPQRYRTPTTAKPATEKAFQQFTTPWPSALLPDAPIRLQASPSLSVSPSTDKYRDACLNPRFNACPAPHHAVRGDLDAFFVDHAEERIEWWKAPDRGPAVVSDLPGGRVPIRWRGCVRGCLDFLEPDEEVPASEEWDSDDLELDP